MDHARVISADELEAFAGKCTSRGVLPELLKHLIVASCPDLEHCAIQDADHIDQPGVDGIVETRTGYLPFWPEGRCYLEVSNERDPRSKASCDLKKRTEQSPEDVRSRTTFVFATFRAWRESEPESWQREHATSGWRDLRVLDSQQLADWLERFPGVARWLLTRTGPGRRASAWRTAAEHWMHLGRAHRAGDPDLCPDLFLHRRDKAADRLRAVFRGDEPLLCVKVDNGRDLEDFVAAFVAKQDEPTRSRWSHRCLFVGGRDEWSTMAKLPVRHVLVADERLELDGAGEAELREATAGGHAVILSVRSVAPPAGNLVSLPIPTKFQVEEQLRKDGYASLRVREVVRDGFTSFSVLKNRLLGKPDLATYTDSIVARQLALVCLAGTFEETCEHDVAIVTTIFDQPFSSWQKAVLPVLCVGGTPLTYRDGRWRVLARDESWCALGNHLLDADLRRFEDAALRVIGEIDPAIELPKHERVFAPIYDKVRQFSESLRKGMAETLALLGSRANYLQACSSGGPSDTATRVVHRLLASTDWTRWMSLHSLLPLLAEAAPEAFLSAVEVAIEDPPSSPFPMLFAQEATGFGGRNYVTGLLWALETLAWHPMYLVRAARLLAALASIDPGGNWANRPANSLRAILLPWHPQTAAGVERRVAAVESVVRAHAEVGWKLVLSLLPESMDMTSSTHKPAWRTELMGEWEEGVSPTEYLEQIERYAALAVELASTDAARLPALIEDLPRLPPASSNVILERIVRVGQREMDSVEVLQVWEALTSLSTRHRAFPDAKWVMPEEKIAAVERAAAAIAPRDPALRHRRTFGSPFRDLGFEKEMTWDDRMRTAAQRRRAALAEIVDGPSIDPIVAFAKKVKAPEEVGEALAALARAADDAQVLPGLLSDEDRLVCAFAEGYVRARWRMGSWTWVETLDMSSWTVVQRVTLFLSLPFQRAVWLRAEQVLGAEAAHYWKAVPPNPWGGDCLEEAAERLILHGRSKFAVGCCVVACVSEQQISPLVAVRALLGCRNDDTKDPLDTDLVGKLIAWVQGQQGQVGVREEDLFAIEWYFLPLLQHRDEAGPQALEGRLARDPAWFCEAVRLVFRADQEDENNVANALDADSAAVRSALDRLLYGMRTVPGMRTDGSIDESVFKNWYQEVMRIASETGYRQGTLSQLGHVFGRAVHGYGWHVGMRTVAEALDAVGGEAMRRTFAVQVRNSRGIHRVTGGREERAIAEHYLSQALAIEELGWHRLASTIRGIAARYQRDAARAEKEQENEL